MEGATVRVVGILPGDLKIVSRDRSTLIQSHKRTCEAIAHSHPTAESAALGPKSWTRIRS